MNLLDIALTSNQRRIYDEMPQSIKDRLEPIQRSAQSTPGSLLRVAEVIRSTVCIFSWCTEEHLKTCERLILTCLGANRGDLVLQIATICNIGYSCFFFHFSTTSKREDYEPKEIEGITDRFNRMIQSQTIPATIAGLRRFDEGGKEQSFSNRALIASSSRSLFSQIIKQADFNQIRKDVLQYLGSLPFTRKLETSVYVFLFRRLVDESKILLLNEEKIAIVRAVVMLTTHPDRDLAQTIHLEDIDLFLDLTLKLHANIGEEAVIYFLGGSGLRSDDSFDEFLRALSLLGGLTSIAPIIPSLVNFHQGLMTLSQFTDHLEELQITSVQELPREENLERLIQRFAEEEFPLSTDQLDTIRRNFLRIEDLCSEFCRDSVSQLIRRAQAIQRKAPDINQDEVLQLVAIGRLFIRIKFGIYPYSTQILSILGFLQGNHNLVAQVKTGQGKSTIITILALVLAMQKKSVDIISSSSYLAVRDEKKYRQFFKSFGLSTSHICSDHQTEDLFRGHILYGTATDFEFAIMREKLCHNRFFAERNAFTSYSRSFDCVIVDEVDNLTVDTLMNGARIAIPVEESHDWIYIPLGKYFNVYLIRRIFLRIQEINYDELRNYLQTYSRGNFRAKIDGLSDEQLSTWISAAHRAFFSLQENIHYVVRPVRINGQFSGREIVIVDAGNMGRRLEGCRWSGGIHEFVELKHNIPPRNESLCPISMSHAVYYPLYSRIYGLTGTMGSQEERSEFKEIFGIHGFAVPPHQPCIRQDAPPCSVENLDIWKDKIYQVALAMHQQRRSILIVCKSIQQADVLSEHLRGNRLQHRVLNDIQEEDEEYIIGEAGKTGAVTIATNIAGRGTDIILDQEVLAQGGLHVLIAFYPESQRVEDQARGRAGRQGQPGSSEILICSSEEGELSALIQRRREREISQREIHAKRARLEKWKQRFIDQFYQKVSQNYALLAEGSHSVTILAQKFAGIRLIDNTKPISETLSLVDQSFAHSLRDLLKDGDLSNTNWKTILQSLVSRAESKALQAWALEFMEPVERILHEASDRTEQEIQDEIERLHESKRLAWEKYLAGIRGILTLIKDLIGIDFSILI